MPTIQVFDTIKETLRNLRNNGQSFTAFDVTLSVQGKLPNEHFLHKEVRDFIHTEMDRYVQCGDYKKEVDTAYPATRYIHCYTAPIKKGGPYPDGLYKTTPVGPINKNEDYYSGRIAPFILKNITMDGGSSPPKILSVRAPDSVIKAGQELMKEMNNVVPQLKAQVPLQLRSEQKQTNSLLTKLKVLAQTIGGHLKSQPKILTQPMLEKYDVKRDKRKRLCIPYNYVKALRLKANDKAIIVDSTICSLTSNPIGKLHATYTVDKHNNIRISNETLIKLGIKETDKINLKVQNNKIYIEKGV